MIQPNLRGLFHSLLLLLMVATLISADANAQYQTCAANHAAFCDSRDTMWYDHRARGDYQDTTVIYYCDVFDTVTTLKVRSDGPYAFCTTPIGNPLPPPPPPGRPNRQDECGSIVEVDSGTLGESIPIVGTGFTLNYRSNRVPGRLADYKAVVKYTGSSVTDYDQVKVEVTIDGATDTFTDTSPTANQSHDYYWDGNDAGSNPTVGAEFANIKITPHLISTGLWGIAEQQKTLLLGSFKAKSVGIGGWTLSPHHYLSVKNNLLYLGDGTTESVVIETMSGGDLRVFTNNGLIAHYFTPAGRHIETRHGLTNGVLFTFSYTGAGYLSEIEDGYGNETVITRDGSGNPTAIVSEDGHSTSLSLDGNGWLDEVTSPATETHTMTYFGSAGLMQTFEKPEGQTSTFTYNGEGRLTSDIHSGGAELNLTSSVATDPFNAWSTYGVSTAEGRAKSISTTFNAGNGANSRVATKASGHVETTTSQTNGATTYSDNWNVTTTNAMTYDARTLNWSFTPSTYSETNGPGSTGPARSTSTAQTVQFNSTPNDPFSYDWVKYVTTESSTTTEYKFTSATKKWTFTSDLGRVQETTVDNQGQTTSTKLGTFTAVTYSYDVRGRLDEVDQSARTTTYAYDGDGWLQTITNPLSQVTSYTYDNSGRVLTQTLPDTRVVTYTYDSNGNVASITPPGKTAHGFIQSILEMIAQYLPPSLSGPTATPTDYTYNDDRQLTKVERPNGDDVDYVYHSTNGLLTSRVTPTGTTYFTNTNGRRTSTTSEDGVVSDTYYGGSHPYHNVLTMPVIGSIGDVEYNFGFKGMVSEVVVSPAGLGPSTFYRTFDDDGFLLTSGSATFTRETNSGFLETSDVSNVTDTYSYDATYGELSQFTSVYTPTPTTLYDEVLTRDLLGRITQKVETIGGTTDTYNYYYDSAGRLIEVKKNSTTVGTYDYDDNSNRDGGVIRTVTTTGTYDSQDRMTAYNSGTYAYNLAGDLTTKTVGGNVTTYVYDALGQLKSVTLPSTTVISYKYDSFGNPVGRYVGGTANKFYLRDVDGRISVEYTGAVAVTSYFVYGERRVPEYMIRGGTTYKIITDHLGSVRIVANASTGVVAQRIDYDEFGVVLSDTSPGFQPFGFAGGMYDGDTKLVRFGARDYDAETGRWTSKDPILFDGKDSNLYGYVLNDPVNYTDPTGKVFEQQIEQVTSPEQQAAGGAAAAAAGFMGGGMCLLSGQIPPAIALFGLAAEGATNYRHAVQNRGASFSSALGF